MAVVATGFFDGVHLGHKAVVSELVSLAAACSSQSLVVTFWPHPRKVLGADGDGMLLLCSKEEREEMLRALGVSRIETLEFTREFASLTCREYIEEILVGRFGASHLVVGYDNRMGSDSLGAEQIASLCRELSLGCTIVPPVFYDGTEISSTRIRRAIASGDKKTAERMLGRSLQEF